MPLAASADRGWPIFSTSCCAKTRPKRDSRKAPPHYDVVGEPSALWSLRSRTTIQARLEPTRTCVKLPPMDPLPSPLAFCLLLFSGWINRQQQAVIEYLREENRVVG